MRWPSDARALALLLAVPVALGAQKRPDYQSLRFEERWAARAPAPGDGWDRLKHVPLTRDGSAYLTLAGQLRWRGELVSRYQLRDGADRDDAFGVTRAALSADVHAGRRARLFAELRDASAGGRELPGGARPQDADRWDVQNLFGEIALGGAVPNVRLRAGRQELSVGRERLVGPGDWSNARRTFDAVRADLAPDARTTVTLLRARPVVLSERRPNRADTNAVLWGAMATRSSGAVSVQALALEWDQRQATLTTAAGTATGAHHRLTTGARVWGATPVAWLAYDVEGAAQRGRVAGRRVAAWALDADVTATGAALPLRPSLSLGAGRASGARDTAVAGTFVAPYPSAHTHDGFVDIVGRQNLDERRATATAQLPAFGQLRVSAFRFARASADDAAYTKQGAVLRRASGDPARHVGDEIDVTLTRPIDRHLKLSAGYGRFAPGAFLRHAAGGAVPEDWAHGGVTFTF